MKSRCIRIFISVNFLSYKTNIFMSSLYKDQDPQETQEWIESIEDALEEHGADRARYLLETLVSFAQAKGARIPFNTSTPFINTIFPSQEPNYPGDINIENRIKSIIRWNAMSMVSKANIKNQNDPISR